MVDKRRIVAVHPDDARGDKKHRLIGRVGYWVRGLQKWKRIAPLGYEHGLFRLTGSPYRGQREINCYAISTIPVKKGG